MSARITPLRLEAFEQLPKHARRCVFWEVDPSTLQGEDHLADPEFEKEAWLSMVMLEWGSCGQIAVACEPDQADFTASASSGDEPCLGYAFYAPPRAVPRAGSVSDRTGQRRRRPADDGRRRIRRRRRRAHPRLMAAVVGDLVRRGVRALEAFGRTAEAAELDRPAHGVTRPALGGRRRSATARSSSASSTPTSSATSDSRSSPRTGTSRGCGSNWSRAWAGRPTSRRRWNDCWRALNCSSRWGPAPVRAAEVAVSPARRGRRTARPTARGPAVRRR